MVGVAKLGGDVSQFSVLSVTAVDSGPAECQLQAECRGWCWFPSKHITGATTGSWVQGD